MSVDIPSHSDFKKSVIAFIDLQGFEIRTKSIKNESDFIEVAKTLLAIKKQFEHFKKNFNQYEITCISDSIIISVPYKDKIATYAMILALQQFQYELLICFKTLLRGYITIGNIYHKDGFVFGEGYVKAYKGEKSGSFPRIVIDDEIINEARVVIEKYSKKEYPTIFDEILQDDKDQNYFINIFKGGLLNKNGKENIHKETEQIFTFINESKNRFSDDEKVLSKYIWTENHILSEYDNFLKNISST
jgi:hypothetical protein